MELLVTVPLIIIDDLGIAAPHRRRGTAGDHHAPLRACQHPADLQLPGGRLGKLLGDAAAVSAMLDSLAASRACAQMRSPELAHQNGRASTGGGRVKLCPDTCFR